MARIVKTNDQEAALREITESIKAIDRINALLKSGGESDKAQVSASVGSAKMPAVAVNTADLVSFLESVRKGKASSVKSLSRKYAIELDDADQAVLEECRKKKAKEEPKAETQAAEQELVAELDTGGYVEDASDAGGEDADPDDEGSAYGDTDDYSGYEG